MIVNPLNPIRRSDIQSYYDRSGGLGAYGVRKPPDACLVPSKAK